MKKSIIAISVLSAVSVTSVYANTQDNAGNTQSYVQNGSQVDQLEHDKAINILGHNSGNVASCVQSGSDNKCNITINVGGSEETYDDSEIKERIEQVNDEDQRVTSGEVSEGKLTLVNRDMVEKADGSDINKVEIDVSSLDQSQDIKDVNNRVDESNKTLDQTANLAVSNSKVLETTNKTVERVKGDVEQNTSDIAGTQQQLNDTVDVWVDSDGNGYGATLTDEHGNSVGVASYDDVKANREAINANTEWDHRQQDQINGNTANIQSLSDYTYEEIDNLYNTKMDKKDFNAYTVYQSEVDSRQDRKLGILDSRVGQLENDITRLDGMIAAQQAANSIILPSNFNGNLAVGVGVGHYAGHNGLSLGVVHDGGDYAVKVTASGTDADDWEDLAYGASVNFTF